MDIYVDTVKCIAPIFGSSTGVTPFSLVYEMEVISPIEVEISLFRVLIEAKLEESEWARARYEQLNMIEEKRLETVCHSQFYQGRLARAFEMKEVANGKWPQTLKVHTSSRMYYQEGPRPCKT
ncbi:hypothetical protein Lal_00011046 [Lupinus albus]|nr:hypothetical protein Lal_00011046 [Lupinus albus]